MSKNKYNWTPKKRDYQQERTEIEKSFVNVTKHPLLPEDKQEEPKKKEEIVDPLSQFTDVEYDPLTTTSDDEEETNEKQLMLGSLMTNNRHKTTFLQWELKKDGILKKYTTDKNIPIVSNILEQSSKGPVKVVKHEERAKVRLEQIQKEESESSDVMYMTQKEYIRYLESLNEELKEAWAGDNRVKALKIVIRATKRLGKNRVPQFYPSLFVLATEVLETFGKLVYERLKKKAESIDQIRLLGDFTSKDIAPEAQEICKNWFYKIASIRELIPRLFILEDKKELVEIFERIERCIRGIGDPLVAAYARCYLARKGIELIPREKKYLLAMFDDFLETQKQFRDAAFIENINNAGLTMDQYLDLYWPALEWVLECLGKDGSEKLFQHLIGKFEAFGKKSLILNLIIHAFEPHIVSTNGSLMVFLINDSDDKALPKSQVYKTLGQKFAQCPPPEKDKLRLLNEIWKYVTKIEDVKEYMQVAQVFVEYVSKSFGMRELNILFADIRKHLKNANPIEVETEIQNTLLAVLENTDDFVEVFNMDHFLPLFDLLKSTTRVEVAKGMLAAFGRREKQEADPVIVNSLFDLAKTVHDSINYMTGEAEIAKISEIIRTFIIKLDFGTAFEKQLNFLVDCRRAFGNLDDVKITLVMSVFQMIAATYQLVKGNHTKKTFNFIKSCFSYCHITIPSIDDIFARLQLFFLAGQLSLLNNLLPQADMLFLHAIDTISKVPAVMTTPDNVVIETESKLVPYVNMLTSSLIAVPGHPEYGPFYLLKALLNVIQSYKWPKGSDARVQIYINVLSALCGLYQVELPYSYPGVNCNDSLYMEDTAYRQEIQTIGNTLLEEILSDMANLGKDSDVSSLQKQAFNSIDLFNNLVTCSDLNSKTLPLAVNLFNLGRKSEDPKTQKYINQTLEFLKQQKDTTIQQLYKNL